MKYRFGVQSVCFMMVSVLVSIFVVLCTLRSIFVNSLVVIVIPVTSATVAILEMIYLP